MPILPGAITTKRSGGGAENHYPTMPIDEIKALDVQSISKRDSVLFMWATFPMLQEALDTMKAWGFDYKTAAFVWVKTYSKSGKKFWGTGTYTRANSEICLLGVAPEFRAKQQILSHKVHQIIESPFEKHSKKPDETKRRIVELLGDISRIELFARNRTEGWDVWGNEV